MKFEKGFRLIALFPQLQSDTNTAVMKNKASKTLLSTVTNFVYGQLEKMDDNDINIPLRFYADLEIPSGKTGREAVIDVIAKIVINDALAFIGVDEAKRVPEYAFRKTDRSNVQKKIKRVGNIADPNDPCGGACKI